MCHVQLKIYSVYLASFDLIICSGKKSTRFAHTINLIHSQWTQFAHRIDSIHSHNQPNTPPPQPSLSVGAESEDTANMWYTYNSYLQVPHSTIESNWSPFMHNTSIVESHSFSRLQPMNNLKKKINYSKNKFITILCVRVNYSDKGRPGDIICRPIC